MEFFAKILLGRGGMKPGGGGATTIITGGGGFSCCCCCARRCNQTKHKNIFSVKRIKLKYNWKISKTKKCKVVSRKQNFYLLFLQDSTIYNSFGQCFGFGSAWISNCFSSPGSGSLLGIRIRIQDKDINNIKKLNCHPLNPKCMSVFFMTKSNFLCRQSLTRIRIRIRKDSHWFGPLDLDPLWGNKLDPDPDPHQNAKSYPDLDRHQDPQHCLFKSLVVVHLCFPSTLLE